jgi:hypothetical protein
MGMADKARILIVPAGSVVVPLEPTAAMVEAGEAMGLENYCSGEDGNWHEWNTYEPADVYRAMVRAAYGKESE